MALPEACPLCRAQPSRQSVVTSHVYGGTAGRQHAVFHCGECDLRYLYPGLSAAEELKFYAREFEGFMADRSAADAGWEQPERHIRANEGQRVRRMRHLNDILDGRKRILEVGCSSGFMLYPLAERSYQCVGVEPSGVFSDYVRSRGVPCYDSMDSLKASDDARQEFDLILHYYVMEHVADPEEFLNQQLELLSRGGMIVFEVPHANDALAALYDIPAYERFIWVVSHRWYFSKPSLSCLLERVGTGDIRFDQRYDLSNHLVWARDGKPGGLGRFTHALGEQIEHQYRQALISAGYGDTLVGFLRK